MSKNAHMNMSNVRSEDQLNKMKELQKLGVCLFCKENIKKYGKNPIIREKKWWLVRKNDYPYEGSKIHLLFVYKKHISSIEKISKEAMTEILDHIKWATKNFKIPGASFVMRFGDNRYTGATITHLHAHLIAGYKKKKDSESIKSYIAFKK